MDAIQILTVMETERDMAFDTLRLGFATDPLTRWMCPASYTYMDIRTGYNAIAGRAVDHGGAFASERFAGVAMWLPPGVEPDSETMAGEFQRLCKEEILEEVFALFEAMAAYHPEEPFWYLPMIGVDPAYQGQGIGAALMKHVLRIIDEQGATAYLDSTNPRNISLYQRHGFEAMGQVQVGSSPIITPMLRSPR